MNLVVSGKSDVIRICILKVVDVVHSSKCHCQSYDEHTFTDAYPHPKARVVLKCLGESGLI